MQPIGYLTCMITIPQIRGARAMLGMKQSELAASAGLSLPTLNNIERGVTDPRVSTLLAIQQALEAAGIRFIGETGVELVTPKAPPSQT